MSLEVNASNAQSSQGQWVLQVIVFAGLAAWWFLSEAEGSRLLCGLLAVICVAASIYDRSAHRTALTLSKRFGTLRLTTGRAPPFARGEVLEVELKLPVHVATQVLGARLSLQQHHRRDQAWGSSSMARRWLCDHREDVEVVAGVESLGAGETLARSASFSVPAKAPPTGDIDRWFVVFEMRCADVPPYEADWRISVT